MALNSDLMAQQGINMNDPNAARVSRFILEYAGDSITASATGTQAAATVLSFEFNRISTAANTGAPYSAVALQPAVVGMEQVVENVAANPIQVFPTNGGSDQINGLSSSSAILVPAGATAVFRCESANTWTSDPRFNAQGATPSSLTSQAGAGAGAARTNGNVNVQTVAAGQGNGADTTDDVLFTFALPANSLDVAGRQVNITAGGKTAANGNNKRFKLWWGTTTQTVGSPVAGGTLIADSGVVTTNAGGWQVSSQVTKYGASGSNTQIAQSSTIAGSTHGGVNAPVALTAAESGAINITVTGSSPTTGAAGDVLGQYFDVQFSN